MASPSRTFPLIDCDIHSYLFRNSPPELVIPLETRLSKRMLVTAGV